MDSLQTLIKPRLFRVFSTSLRRIQMEAFLRSSSWKLWKMRRIWSTCSPSEKTWWTWSVGTHHLIAISPLSNSPWQILFDTQCQLQRNLNVQLSQLSGRKKTEFPFRLFWPVNKCFVFLLPTLVGALEIETIRQWTCQLNAKCLQKMRVLVSFQNPCKFLKFQRTHITGVN